MGTRRWMMAIPIALVMALPAIVLGGARWRWPVIAVAVAPATFYLLPSPGSPLDEPLEREGEVVVARAESWGGRLRDVLIPLCVALCTLLLVALGARSVAVDAIAALAALAAIVVGDRLIASIVRRSSGSPARSSRCSRHGAAACAGRGSRSAMWPTRRSSPAAASPRSMTRSSPNGARC